MLIEINVKDLEEKGFVFNNQENVIMDYTKKINDRVRLVFSISPLLECFIWVLDEDYEDENMDGMKVHILPCSLDEAVLIAEKINYIE